jgi:hypothetical protein
VFHSVETGFGALKTFCQMGVRGFSSVINRPVGETGHYLQILSVEFGDHGANLLSPYVFMARCLIAY